MNQRRGDESDVAVQVGLREGLECIAASRRVLPADCGGVLLRDVEVDRVRPNVRYGGRWDEQIGREAGPRRPHEILGHRPNNAQLLIIICQDRPTGFKSVIRTRVPGSGTRICAPKPPRMSRTRSHRRTRYRSVVVDRAPLRGSRTAAKPAFDLDHALRQCVGVSPARRVPAEPRLVVWLVGDDGDHVADAFVHVTVRLLDLLPPC